MSRSRGVTREGFASCPNDPDRWIRSATDGSSKRGTAASGFTARLTIDVTPELRGRIKVVAFQRGTTVADMLRDLLDREFPTQRSRQMMQPSSLPLSMQPAVEEPSPYTTLVELTWREKRIEYWIRFGNGRAPARSDDPALLEVTLRRNGAVMMTSPSGPRFGMTIERLCWLFGYAAAPGRPLRRDDVILIGARIGPLFPSLPRAFAAGVMNFYGSGIEVGSHCVDGRVFRRSSSLSAGRTRS